MYDVVVWWDYVDVVEGLFGLVDEVEVVFVVVVFGGVVFGEGFGVVVVVFYC